jgi:hypothetical protein
MNGVNGGPGMERRTGVVDGMTDLKGIDGQRTDATR